MEPTEEKRDWMIWGKYDTFRVADSHRSRLIKGSKDLVQGENIQIKAKSDGQFHLRIARNRLSEETRKALNLK